MPNLQAFVVWMKYRNVYIFSMLSALFLVLLPLPDTRNTCALQSPDTVRYSLVPFYFIWDVLLIVVQLFCHSHLPIFKYLNKVHFCRQHSISYY
jgi:hypothetical protein